MGCGTVQCGCSDKSWHIISRSNTYAFELMMSQVLVLTSHAMMMQKGRRVVRKDSTRLQVLIGQSSLKQALQQSVSFRHNDG